ncbi:hypothetical protein TCAL_01322 [Tigriopus californicus]|uniref:BZIP domain-containing protein n=1 Tax=Tigriopus californicus TaxID=6832 RepID=A0A553P9X3_TIGCA|nr:hypothetical protein TCAL_01322 [Tigriopus californicus]
MSRQANKRGLTLDLNSAPAAKKTRVTGLTPGNPPILTTPDVQMLKLSSPDVARFLSNPTLTPTTQTPYGFNKFVTEEQELYAKGFEDALNSVSSQERTTDISTIEKATAAHRSNLVIAAHAIANQPPLPVTTPMLSQAPPPAVVISAPTPSVLADISTSMHQSRPSSGASGSLDSSEANLPEGVRVKEEEDHDDDDDDDSSSKSGVGYSPVDMESQEKLKLERKRLRNRVAASKCRKKKLERISQLDEKVQGLKNENTELAAVVKKLKESVCNLKQEVIDHVNQDRVLLDRSLSNKEVDFKTDIYYCCTAIMSERKTSLRDLRLSQAANLLSTSRVKSTLAPSTLRERPTKGDASLGRTFNAAPKQRLNLSEARSRDWVSRADAVLKAKESAKKETKRARKRRQWQERLEARKSDGLTAKTPGDNQSPWAFIPDLVLEKIFRYLPFQEVLDTVQASNALNKIAHKLRQISFIPKRNLHNTCVFQRIMTKFCEYKGSLPDVELFSYTFPCDFARKSNETDIYGTGGMILQDMKSLLRHFPGLKKLELIDLQLDGVDACHVLDEVSSVCAQKITHLSVINTSRRPLSLLAVASFVNLRCLIISPHNLGDDLVECLGDMPKMRNIQIITNNYTECVPTPVDYRIWKECRKSNPRLRVHLITEGKHSKELTFQARAPVRSVVYDTPYTKVSNFSINLVVDMYGTDLECYAHKRLPRFTMAKSFYDRPDTSYLLLVRQCPYIHTLMIRERISSATVLLIAYTGKNLRFFHVRKNAIVLKCEWPKNPEWSWEFYRWLKKNSRSYEDMEREVSQILGFRWYALNDKQFKVTPLNLNVPYYYEGFDEH